MLGFLKGRSHLVGSYSSGFSQYSGARWRFQVEIKISVPLNTLTPPDSPEPPAGRVSSVLARRMSTGGSGYKRSASIRANLNFFIAAMSSKSGRVLLPMTVRTSAWISFNNPGSPLASPNIVHVSMAAVVSCPAINIVIKSSRRTLEVRSSPLMSTKNLNNEGSSPTSLSSSSSTDASFLVETALLINLVKMSSNIPISFRNST
mmetsp:Transcript_28878/g.57651  ORF Transcript_28878/g.57651 Transcript_28878/m.57651 type:complete len:204 (-) Transcript_28878:1473-2084(-)